ncbi:unannotated protein [freshwater metagenome]|uniref:Unannotated protein n=1 Tax=freshwater metagenome TaxID=449393 RepID=A0A6J6KJC9_9ZZZZ
MSQVALVKPAVNQVVLAFGCIPIVNLTATFS